MTRILAAIVLIAGALMIPENAFAAATPRTCPTGITKDMVITYNDDVSCTLDVVGEIDFYRFQGAEGEQIHITMSPSANRGPCFSLFDPSGTNIQEVCNGSIGLPWVASAKFSLTKTGTYTIRAYDYQSDGTFSYRIYLERSSPPYGALPIAYGQSLAGSIDPGEETDQWVFAGGSGDQIAIQVTPTANRGPCFGLYLLDGTLIQNELCNGSIGLPWVVRGEFTLPASATYLIRVFDYQLDSAWNYNLFLQCLGTCTAGTLGIPTLNISLTGCTNCVNGNVFSARLTTAATMPAPAKELKLGFYLPDASQSPAIDPHIELPPGFTFDGEVLRGTISPAHQRGSWMLCGRIIGLAGGDIMAASCQTFTIAP